MKAVEQVNKANAARFLPLDKELQEEYWYLDANGNEV